MVIRPFVLQAYFIPSPSMEPTLLGKDNVGDRILVNKFLYRLHPPRRDDVVVFLAPPAATEGSVEPNADFIKRLIGVPGDIVQAVHGSVNVNGTDYNHTQVRDALGHAGEFGTDAESEASVDQADHHVKFVADGVLADGHLIPKQKLAADLEYARRRGHDAPRIHDPQRPAPEQSVHRGRPGLRHAGISGPSSQARFRGCGSEMEYKLGPLPDQPNSSQPLSAEEYARDRATAPGAIPPHELLMMGDNRNDSNDGTNWGLLRDKRVVGRAVFIFWPLTRMHPIQ